MTDPDQSAEAVVDYCRTQARLLSGQATTLSGEIDSLLDEIDAEAIALRDRLDGHQTQTDSPDQPANPRPGSDDEDAVAQLEAKQATVADKQERLDAIGELSAGYVDLAEAIQTGSTEDAGDTDIDQTEAITQVLEFEADHDAPDFFDERTTLLETAADQ
jgi:hypothetical protein